MNKLFDYLIMVVYANAGIANSVNPDQTAPSGAVCSGFSLFVLAWLCKYLSISNYSKLICQCFEDVSQNQNFSEECVTVK